VASWTWQVVARLCRMTLVAASRRLQASAASTASGSGPLVSWTEKSIFAGRDVATAQLAWLAPTLWLVACAALAGVVLRSAPAATALVATTWLFEQIQHDTMLHSHWLRQIFLFTTTYAPGSHSWLSDRLWLVTTACVLAVVAARLLQRPHRLLRGDS